MVRSVHGKTEDRVEPTLDPPALHVLLGHALEAAELLPQCPHHLVGDTRGLEGVDAVAVVVHRLAVVLVAELLADGLHLPAQDVLALLLVEPVADLMADLVGQLTLRQRVLGPAEHEPDPLGDVDRLEQLDLLLGRQLGPPPDQVGEAAGVVGVDAPEDAADLAVAEVLEERDQGGAQLGAQRLGLVGGGLLDHGLGRHPQAGPGADHAGTQPGSAGGAHDEGGGATRQHAGRLDRGDGADLGEPVTDAGDEQQLAALAGSGGRGLGLVGLGADRHDHAGEDDAVGKGEGGEGVGFERLGHGASELLAMCKRQPREGFSDSHRRRDVGYSPAKGPGAWKARAWKRSPMRW